MRAIQHLKVVGPANVKRTVALPVRKPNAAYRSREHLTERDFCVEDGGALGVGEAAHLIVGEGDVIFEVLWQIGPARSRSAAATRISPSQWSKRIA